MPNDHTPATESDVIATGYWCTDCEFFEDGSDMGDLDCHACGCRREDHVRVVLIPSPESAS